MTIVRERTAVDRQRIRKSIRYRMVYIAGLLALFIVFAVQTGTRYVMDQWTHDKLERLISVDLHRKVSLGKTSWSLGLNGLIVATDHISILNRDGKSPFLGAGRSEIGMPLLPMLAGDFQLRYLRLEHPQVWAIKTGPREWNFSDIPGVKALKNVAFIDIVDGKLNVIDKSNDPPARWSPRVLQRVAFHLERPFQNQRWPFSIALEVPNKKRVTTLHITGIGNGAVDEWYRNNHKFNLRARQLDLSDFSDLWPNLPPIAGVLDVDLDGHGIPQKSFDANAQIQAPILTVTTPALGPITIRDGVTSGHFNFGNDHLQWDNVIVKLGRFDLRSDGKMLNWLTRQPSYDATVTVNTDDLNKLAALLPARLLPRDILPRETQRRILRDRKQIMTIEEALRPARVSGQANVVARVTGTGKNTKVWADITARKIRMSSLATLRPFKELPILGILGSNPNATLDLKMNFVPDGRSEISSGQIHFGRSQINFSGYLFAAQQITHIAYSSAHLDLAEVTTGFTRHSDRTHLNRLLGLPPSTDIKLRGAMSVRGTIDTHGKKQIIATTANLQNAELVLNNGAFRAHHVQGTILFNGTDVMAQNLSGAIGDGPFSLNGRVSTLPGGPINIQYKGRSLDLGALRNAAVAMNINSPLLANRYVRGRLRNVNLLISGTTERPVVDLVGEADNVAFQQPGTPGLVTVTGGTFHVRDNKVFIQNLGGSIGSGNFVLNGTIEGSSSNLVMTGQHVDISHFQKALIDLNVDSPIVRAPRVIFGKVRSATLVIRSSGGKTDFKMTAIPEDVYYQPKGMPRTFILTGGVLRLTDNVASFQRLSGNLGDGTFVINGFWNLASQSGDIRFSGRKLDVSNIKVALQALNVKSPLLAEQKLYGKLRVLDFTMKGHAKAPVIGLIAEPQDVRFEAYGSSRTITLKSGRISFQNDELKLDRVNIVSPRSQALISLQIGSLSKQSQLKELHIATRGLDLGDITSYLAAPRTPQAVRDKFNLVFDNLGLRNLGGKLVGRLDYKRIATPVAGREFTLSIDLDLEKLTASIGSVTVHDLTGHLHTRGNDLLFRNFAGKIGRSPFTGCAVVREVTSANRNWTGEIQAQLDVPDLLTLIPASAERLEPLVTSSAPIPVRIGIDGSAQRTAAAFTSTIAADSTFIVRAPVGDLTKPANTEVAVVGSLVYEPGRPSIIRFYDSQLKIGETAFQWEGTYAWPHGDLKEEPMVDFVVRIPTPINARNLLSLLPVPSLEQTLAGMTGRVGGQVRLTGPLSTPATQGRLDLFDVNLPGLNISGITGSIDVPNWFAPRMPGRTAELTGDSRLNVHVKHLTAGPLLLTEIQGLVVTESTPDGTRVTLDNVVAGFYGGNATLSGSILMNATRPVDITASLSDVNVENLVKSVAGVENELTGRLNAFASFRANAGTPRELAETLQAHGRFLIADGKVTRLGELKTNLQRLNLLKEGIVGFNFSNLFAALGSVDNGDFKTFSGQFAVDNQVIALNRLFFNGEELRLRAEGVVELIPRKATLRVAGNIPRVAKGILKGPIGTILQHLSIQSILRVATFGMLDDFPSIPIIGALGGSNKPRSFEFVASGSFDEPETFVDSIVDTLRWLPNERNATPYPVFGVGARPDATPL